MPGETTLQRALREAAILYGPEPRETIMNPHFVRAEREPPTFLDGLRGAAQRLNRHPQEGLLQDDHTVLPISRITYLVAETATSTAKVF